MIRDIIIIKDGLPLLSKNFSNVNNAFTQADNLIMISGFFSALDSFSDQFDGLGAISELKLDQNDMKLSFLRDPTLPNLVYLATYDDDSKGMNVKRALRKISNTFLKQYNTNQILNWRGRRNAFQAFEETLSQYVEEEEVETEEGFKEKVVELFQNVQEKLNDGGNGNNGNGAKNPEYYNFVPFFKVKSNVNPSYYLTGQNSISLFKNIDGKRTIDDLASNLGLSQEKVYNICKNLVKMGFIAFYNN